MVRSKKMQIAITLFLILLCLFAYPLVDVLSIDSSPTLTYRKPPLRVPEKFNYTRHLRGSISLPTESHAYVGKGNFEPLKVGGSVEVQEYGASTNPNPYYIELSAHVDGLECQIIPNTFTEEDIEAHYFTVYVEVPQYTSCSKSFKLTVTGFTKYIRGTQTYTLEPDETIIKMKQYYIVMAEPKEHTITLKEGQTKKIDFTLKNYGNGADTIRVKVKENRLNQQLIQYSWREKTIFLNENGKQKLTINITANGDIYSGSSLLEEIYIYSNASKAGSGPERLGEIYINIELQDSSGIFKWEYSWLFILLLTILSVMVLVIINIFQIRNARRRKMFISFPRISKIALSSFIFSLGLIMTVIFKISTSNRSLHGNLSHLLDIEMFLVSSVMGILCIIFGLVGINITKTKSKDYKGIGFALFGTIIGSIVIFLILYSRF